MSSDAIRNRLPVQIAILDDCADRRVEMQRRLSKRFPHHPAVYFETAPEMIDDFSCNGLDGLLLISLDHDLEPPPGRESFDPGCGRDVSDFLLTQRAICPVIIHTTNTHAGDGMQFSLEDAVWRTHRVVPYDGEQWIRESWLHSVRVVLESSLEHRQARL